MEWIDFYCYIIIKCLIVTRFHKCFTRKRNTRIQYRVGVNLF